MFEWFFLIWLAFFAFVAGTIIRSFVKSVREERKNDASPRLTVPAAVVAKRDEVRVHHHDHHRHTSTRYFVTFEVESGDRMELQVSGSEYGMMVEGDRGNLTFQGTRFLNFERTRT